MFNVFNLGKPVSFQPQALQTNVLVQRFYLLKAFEVEVELVVKLWCCILVHLFAELLQERFRQSVEMRGGEGWVVAQRC